MTTNDDYVERKRDGAIRKCNKRIDERDAADGKYCEYRNAFNTCERFGKGIARRHRNYDEKSNETNDRHEPYERSAPYEQPRHVIENRRG